MGSKYLKRKAGSSLSSAHDIDEADYSSEEVYTDVAESDNDSSAATGKKLKRFKSYCNNDDLFHNQTSPSSAISSTKATIARMPTRRPDPRVSNRNAIMARENRRKKKEHFEILQKNVDETQSENKKLKKMLRVRDNAITRLKEETAYLRSVLANKTEIMSLLKTIQGNRTPITSSTLSFVTDQGSTMHKNTSRDRSARWSPASSTSSALCEEDDKENGTVWSTQYGITNNDPFLSARTQPNNFIFTDLDSVGVTSEHSSASPEQHIEDFEFEKLLGESSSYQTGLGSDILDLRDFDDNEILSTNANTNTVNIEHNYFNNPIINKVADQADSSPGICLHLSSGRVSLEFCASCHMNSLNAWCEEV